MEIMSEKLEFVLPLKSVNASHTKFEHLSLRALSLSFTSDCTYNLIGRCQVSYYSAALLALAEMDDRLGCTHKAL